MTLLEECIEVLQPNIEILSKDQSKKCGALISDNFPIQINGRVDWGKVIKKTIINDYSEISDCLKNVLGTFDDTIFVFWARADLPVLQASLSKVIKYIDDVLAVGFDDAWIISQSHKFIIEFYHDGEITLGFF